MKRLLTASTLLAGLAVASAAWAQPAQNASQPMSTNGADPMTAPGAMPSGAGAHNPAVVLHRGDALTTAAPVAGHNSFTMKQVAKRLRNHGYTQVQNLKLDENSVWRGMAMKDGKSVAVAVDFQGNITAQ